MDISSIPQLPEHIPAWVSWGAAVLFAPLVWMFIKKAIISYVVNAFVNAVDDALVMGDDDDDDYVIATVHWIERKATKLEASGPDRYRAVAKYICSKANFIKGREDAIAELLQGLVEGVDAAADRIEKRNKTADSCPVPPAPPAA